MNPAVSTSASNTLSRPLALPALARRGLTLALGSLFVAVCAHIAVPLWFTPVPVTMQTFAVLLLGLVLSPGMAASVMAAYLIEGMAGLPVLAPTGTVALLHIFGPTGGYLLSYPAVAALVSYLRRRFAGTQSARGAFTVAALTAGVGGVLILLSGAAWFGILTHQSAMTVLALTVAPFLAGDILKTLGAAGVATGLRRYRRG